MIEGAPRGDFPRNDRDSRGGSARIQGWLDAAQHDRRHANPNPACPNFENHEELGEKQLPRIELTARQ